MHMCPGLPHHQTENAASPAVPSCHPSLVKSLRQQLLCGLWDAAGPVQKGGHLEGEELAGLRLEFAPPPIFCQGH